MRKRTSGWRARNGVVSDATMPSTVGIAAIRISPESLSLRLLISCRIARVSPTMRRAQSSVRSPSGVKPWNREPRCTSMTPRISSSCLRLVDIVGWVTPQASAARPKCRSFASASRSSSLSIKRKPHVSRATDITIPARQTSKMWHPMALQITVTVHLFQFAVRRRRNRVHCHRNSNRYAGSPSPIDKPGLEIHHTHLPIL